MSKPFPFLVFCQLKKLFENLLQLPHFNIDILSLATRCFCTLLLDGCTAKDDGYRQFEIPTLCSALLYCSKKIKNKKINSR